MTTGLGFSIGTVNIVSALVTAEQPRPVVRTRRTTIGFDEAGGARLGGLTELPDAHTEFADLGRDPESVVVGGRIWSPANMFAAVVRDLLAAAEPAAAVVTTYPAHYCGKQVALLRQALDLSGAGHVELVPEPVAAAHWLENEHGPLAPGFVLVYDLGGNSLDVTVVRVGPDWDNPSIVGGPVRCYDFGGRPLGAMIARYAGDRAIRPAEPGSDTVSPASFIDIEGMRVEQVRDSLEVVRVAVHAAGIGLSDIGRVLVIGGAARPPQVARTLAELGLPVVMSADPGQCVASGAAAIAVRNAAPAARDRSQRAPIFSGAAIFSAVAMSAATMLGGGAVEPDADPATERFPGLDSGEAPRFAVPDRATLNRTPNGGWSVSYDPPRRSAYTDMVSPAAYGKPYGPSLAESRPRHSGPRDCCAPDDRGAGYSDPARFTNPIPFRHPAPRPVHPPLGHHPTRPGHPALPHDPDGPVVSPPSDPSGPIITPPVGPDVSVVGPPRGPDGPVIDLPVDPDGPVVDLPDGWGGGTPNGPVVAPPFDRDEPVIGAPYGPGRPGGPTVPGRGTPFLPDNPAGIEPSIPGTLGTRPSSTDPRTDGSVPSSGNQRTPQRDSGLPEPDGRAGIPSGASGIGAVPGPVPALPDTSQGEAARPPGALPAPSIQRTSPRTSGNTAPAGPGWNSPNGSAPGSAQPSFSTGGPAGAGTAPGRPSSGPSHGNTTTGNSGAGPQSRGAATAGTALGGGMPGTSASSPRDSSSDGFGSGGRSNGVSSKSGSTGDAEQGGPAGTSSRGGPSSGRR
ncbi:Hsp70 family protein [Nocardia donostiensis]|uniref:Hsp70 family protein n=1 Tax=Nocardia donostiensis TaxID=1538463 RepID=A0A1W0B2K9_9NOCA|nr:Hsp70 family protein [Nocardia donostiensis]ONM48561.1 hypothetical protein B0T46_10890 [Nocardia donostiensis]OQS16752.1 hypothetical protein B0T36_03575 [Nocardia donostiensis]OQS23215.1 hypothetical protein B0T44_02890 [Nocardia donostiensis]